MNIQPVWQFFRDLFRKIVQDQISFAAAAIAFYAWMSIFPLLLAGVSALGIWLGMEGAREQTLDILSQNLPVLKASGIDFYQLLEHVSAIRGVTGLIALLGLLWTGIQVVLATQVALNRVFGAQVHLSWITARFRALLFVVIAGMLSTLSLISTYVVGLIPYPAATRAASWMAGFALMAMIFAAAYRVLPRLELAWRFALIGGAATSLMWTLANAGLLLYFRNFGHFDKMYGSFTGVVIILLACYYLSFVTLVGAEVTDVLTQRFGRPKERTAARHSTM
ncbi:MAG: YihY/virulence factor BrkB family protein [Armatimonadetes bacterium]|nr:YihY/virulence factor BrkB family protein [Armatimonadota bacterium]